MRTLVMMGLALLCQVVSVAATIHVPADQPTIKAGINAAVNGDTVLVAPGYYYENLTFAGKAIIVKSSDGPEKTTIDGSMPQHGTLASVVMFRNGEGLDSVLDGFTIRGGRGTYTAYHKYGGGVFCEQASPMIVNNIIRFNKAHYGGGIACKDHASPEISNNLIERNSTDVNSAGPIISKGGGIYCVEYSSPTISNNCITMNTTDPYYIYANGGGIYCNADSSPNISHNTISDNVAGGRGCGIFISYSLAIISNNTITGNRAGDFGGGIHCANQSYPMIQNNTISGNSVKHDGGGIYFTYSFPSNISNNRIFLNSAANGGGTWCFSSSNPTLSNNMICGNTAEKNGGGIFFQGQNTLNLVSNTMAGNAATKGGGIFCSESASLKLSNMIMWDDSASSGPEVYMDYSGQPATLEADYSDVKGGLSSLYIETGIALNWGSHMYDADPHFVDSAGKDYHLVLNSPCRNKGDNTATAALEDFEGDPRVAANTIDLGADEQYYHFYCTGNFTPGGVMKGKFIGTNILNPVWLIIGSGIVDPPMAHNWGDLYLGAPWWVIPMGKLPVNGVLVVPQQIPATVAVPTDVPMQALINKKLTNLYVLEIR